jgi:hypothetical protein
VHFITILLEEVCIYSYFFIETIILRHQSVEFEAIIITLSLVIILKLLYQYSYLQPLPSTFLTSALVIHILCLNLEFMTLVVSKKLIAPCSIHL